MLRKWLLSLIVLIPTVAFAADKWEPIPALKRVTTNGRKVASQTITKGGCTVNVAPSPGGAYLTFTCPETAWQLYVRNTDKGLQVRRAELRRTPAGNFMRVLYEANIAEIFVPYHDGDPEHRLSDNQFCHSAVCIREVTAQDIAGATAQLITMSGDTTPTAAVEIRDRGLAWMCKWGTGSHSRRGQEMVIWGTWDTGNYDYIIEYSFRDDGQMSFRLGATGWDNPNYSPGLAHMHDILWRVDVDLNGDLDDSALLESHDEVGLVGVDSEVTFNNGVEGGAVLNPVKFEALVVEDDAVNQRGNPYAYELQPFPRGIARHAEAWCQDDVWVTRYHGNEPGVPSYWTDPTAYLLGTSANPAGIFNGESIQSEDVVVWYRSPIHHSPHDEDQSPADTGNTYSGLTLTHWTGFDLVPQNVFNFNPLGAPDRSQCP